MACPMGYGDAAKAQRDAEVRESAGALPADLAALFGTYERLVPACSEPHRLLNKCYRRVATEDPTGNCARQAQCFLACNRARMAILASVRGSCASAVAHGVQPQQVLDSYAHCVAAAAAAAGAGARATPAAAGPTADVEPMQRCIQAATEFLQCATRQAADPKNCPAGHSA